MSSYAIPHSLKIHLDWLKILLDKRIEQYFAQSDASLSDIFPGVPTLKSDTPLDYLFQQFEMSWEERVVLLLAITPHIKPQLLDIFFTDNPNINRGFTEFGGLKGKKHNGFLPTGETAVFILAGQDMARRLEVMRIFRAEHFLFKHKILEFQVEDQQEPTLSMPLMISQPFLRRILWDELYEPDFGPGFPAKRVNTPLEWEDLVLPPYILDQIYEIINWLKYEDQIQEGWGLQKWIKPGYRSLFFGPPGTGKTLTASLIGKALGLPVYRIDLSMVVSKYIGETEKNLASVFDQAEQHQWILFFDEADALFGKRTQTKSSHDRYANQEVSYLLQRVEDYPGLVILASNFKGNLDEAFIRRFQSMIHFTMPSSAQRLELWKKALSGKLELASAVDLEQIAQTYEVSGGEIINVLRTLAIKAAERGKPIVYQADILDALRKEFRKSGKVVLPQ